jgi:uncharacterized membrane protein HdeD (DUF308 family)
MASGRAFVAVPADIAEIGATFTARGGWKLLNALLTIVFIVAGVLAFIRPRRHLRRTRRDLQLLLIFAGTFGVIQAIAARREIEVWWLQLRYSTCSTTRQDLRKPQRVITRPTTIRRAPTG